LSFKNSWDSDTSQNFDPKGLHWNLCPISETLAGQFQMDQKSGGVG